MTYLTGDSYDEILGYDSPLSVNDKNVIHPNVRGSNASIAPKNYNAMWSAGMHVSTMRAPI